MFELTAPLKDAKGKVDADHYPTPPLLALEGLREIVRIFGHPKIMLEPGSAERAPFLAAAANPDWHHGWRTRLLGVELRASECPSFVGEGYWWPETDYLRWNLLLSGEFSDMQPDLIMTNPPFSLATEFIEHSRKIVHEMGLVVMLLQTGIEGANKRRDFWKRNKPILKLTPRPRPGFVKGGNDSREYAFYCFAGFRLAMLLEGLGRDHWDSRFLDCPSDKGWGRAEG